MIAWKQPFLGLRVGLYLLPALLLIGCAGQVYQIAQPTSTPLPYPMVETSELLLPSSTPATPTLLPYPTFTPGPDTAATLVPDTHRALVYLAGKYALPLERLQVVYQNRREYPNLGKAVWVIQAIDIGSNQSFLVAVDLGDGHFEESLEALDQAERDAAFARYGPLDPALYERLQTMLPEEPVKVAIWVAGESRSQQELYQVLADAYPEAKEAMERSGKPFDVADPGLAEAMEAEYLRLLAEDANSLIQPLVDELTSQGISVSTVAGMPAVHAILSKAQIEGLVPRPDVGAVYLLEGTAEEAGEKTLPFPGPTSTPPADLPTDPAANPSPQALIALQYISQRESIPVGDLNFKEHVRSYPLLGKQYVAVVMYDRVS